MVESRTTTDPSGRVTIVEKDDRGSSYPIILSQNIDVRGISAFSELGRITLERARKGHLFLSATAQTNGAFTGSFVAIEVKVVGYVASAASVLLYTAMDSNINLVNFAWDEPNSYTALGIEARQIVDGLASGTTTGIDFLNFSVAGTYWR